MQIPPEAAVQGGRFSYAQARAAGTSRRALQRALSLGLIHQVRPGVYVAVGPGLSDPVARHRAAIHEDLLARPPGWVVARRTAAMVYGLSVIGPPPSVPQLVRDRKGDAQGSSRHARVSTLPPSQVADYAGLPMASPARVVVDLARSERFRNALVVADSALRRGVTREELEAVLRVMPRWPGVRAARRVVRLADGRSESPGESLTRAAHLEQDLPDVEPQVEVLLDGEVVARLDLLMWDVLLAVEFNGAVKFTGEGVLPSLLGRQEVIRSCGIDVLNTDWDEVFVRQPAYARRVRERIAQRGPVRLARGVSLRSTLVRPVKPLLSLAVLTAAEQRPQSA